MSLLLIVDDEPAVGATLVRVLRRAFPPGSAPTIVTAESPDEALLAMDAADAYDGLVVVSDFNLNAPSSGLDLLAEAARRHPGARRILMSGYAEETLSPQLSSAGLDAFVPKPFDARRMADLVRTLVAKTHGS